MTKRNLGQALDEEFKESLRWLADNCEFNSLARIRLASHWLHCEYECLCDRLGVTMVRNSPEDLDAYYQLGFDPPDSVMAQANRSKRNRGKLNGPISRRTSEEVAQ